MNIYATQHYTSPRRRSLTWDETETRRIAYALKVPTEEAIDTAARDMARAIPHNVTAATLIPIPTSAGSVEPNRKLANAIAKHFAGDARVIAAIERVTPVESSCSRRRRGLSGLTEADHDFRRIGPMMPAAAAVYFVDNVTTTGATLRAARAALGFGDALVFATAGR